MGNLVVKDKMDLAGYGDDFNVESSEGFEDTTIDSYSIPYIRMIQSNSGAVKKSSEFYIEGAKTGQLLNGLTRQAADTFYIVPIHQETRFDLKRQEANGKKFIGSYLPSDDKVLAALQGCNNDKYHCFNDEGDQFFETSYLKVLHFNIKDGKAFDIVPSMISFSSYNLKVSQDLMTRCSMGDGGKLKLFTNVLELGTVTKPKDGNEWFIFKFKFLGKIPQLDISNGVELYNSAKKFYDSSKNNTVELDHGAE